MLCLCRRGFSNADRVHYSWICPLAQRIVMEVTARFVHCNRHSGNSCRHSGNSCHHSRTPDAIYLLNTMSIWAEWGISSRLQMAGYTFGHPAHPVQAQDPTAGKEGPGFTSRQEVLELRVLSQAHRDWAVSQYADNI